MITKTPILTNAGQTMLIRAIGGETITFTKFKIGNGDVDDSEILSLIDLINPLVSFGISEIDKNNEGFCRVTGSFTDAKISENFRFKELGIFAKIGDEDEQLYAYVNDGENAGMLKAGGLDITCEQTISLIIAVGTAENVTATLSESVLYASKDEFENHTNNKDNPHNVTAAQIGLEKVPNVSTNDQTPTYTVSNSLLNLISGERMSTAFGKIAKAVSSLMSHISNKNNPHEVSLEDLGGAEAEHVHSTADITTGVLSAARGGTGYSSIASMLSAFGLGDLRIKSGSTFSKNSNEIIIPFNNGLKLIFGKVSIQADAHQKGATAIDYGTNYFSQTPFVIATLNTESLSRTASVANVSRQGFDIVFQNNADKFNTNTAYYLAIG